MAKNHEMTPEEFQEIQMKEYQANIDAVYNSNPALVNHANYHGDGFINPPVYENPNRNQNPGYPGYPNNVIYVNSGAQMYGNPNGQFPPYNQNIYYSQGNQYPYPQSSPMFSPAIIVQDPIQLVQLTDEEQKILRYSRYVRYCAISEMIIDFFYLMVVPFLLITLILDMLGYFGGRYFNKFLCLGYSIYLIFVILARLLIIIYYPRAYVIVIFVILIGFESFQIGLIIKFMLMLYRRSKESIERLRNYIKVTQSNWMCC